MLKNGIFQIVYNIKYIVYKKNIIFENAFYKLKEISKSKTKSNIKMKSIILNIAILFIFSNYLDGQQLFTYDWPTGETEALLSDKYRITLELDGKSYSSEVIMSKSKDIEIYDAFQQFRGGRTFNWTMFSYDFRKPVTVTVEKLFGNGSPEVEIFPSPFNIKGRVSGDGKRVTFRLDSPKYISVNFRSDDNKHTSDGVIKHMLMIFADTLETDVPGKNGEGVHIYSQNSTVQQLTDAKTIYFPRGYHDLSAQFDDVSNMAPAVKDGKRIYFEGGSYVHGRISKVTAANVKIFGRGVLSGVNFKWSDNLAKNGGKLGVDSFKPREAHISISQEGEGPDSNNSIDGIIVCDGPAHGVNLGKSSTYLNFKIWGWHYNNDGIRAWGGNSIIDHCFIRPCDDAVYNKGVTITNTVFWPGFNGSILCLGWNGEDDTENSTLVNNYVINPEWRRLGNNNGIVMSQVDYDMIATNVYIKNMWVDGDVPALVNLHTSSEKRNKGDFSLPMNWSQRLGHICKITLENVVINGGLYEYSGSGYEQSKTPSRNFIQGTKLTNGETYYIEDVNFINVLIEGDCLTDDLRNNIILP